MRPVTRATPGGKREPSKLESVYMEEEMAIGQENFQNWPLGATLWANKVAGLAGRGKSALFVPSNFRNFRPAHFPGFGSRLCWREDVLRQKRGGKYQWEFSQIYKDFPRVLKERRLIGGALLGGPFISSFSICHSI